MSANVSFLARYDALDRALVAAGFPPTSPWWRDQLGRFFRSGRRRWVIRAGRRAGKSSTLCRLAVAVALWGDWSVPPGDVAVIPFVSVDRDEASARLRTIAAILRALGVSFDERGDELELRDKRLVFRVVTGSVRGTVGFTSVAVFADEMARWESRDTAANPAREVMASLRPTMATQPSAFEVAVSSPWGTDDYHAELFEIGEDDHQLTSFAETWTANPTLTEERTHELEPDPRVWAREYAAEPGVTLSAALDPADTAASFRADPRGLRIASFLSVDASSLRGDAFAYVAGHETDAGELQVTEVRGWEGDELRSASLESIVDAIAARAKAFGVRRIFGDQRETAGLEALFARRNLSFESIAWSQSSKDGAIMLLRRLMRERRLCLVEHAGLRRELMTMKARLMPSGLTRYETNGLDYASALITVMHAANERRLVAGYNPAAGAYTKLREHRWKLPSWRFSEGRGYVGDGRFHDCAPPDRGERKSWT
jgi:hypothetical protein